MADYAIRAERLGKLYRIGHVVSSRNLREALVEGMTASFRRLPFLGDRRRSAADEEAEEWFWAVKDVSFEVKPGSVVGIIGSNGAGKSTLLKMLCRITEPTEGAAEIHGRVGSLLEVGTGFHSELTGRENVFLNGAILGMSRTEIKRKFDDIVAFADIGRFLDTPVKRYSSGMYVRLAFAVAAHFEPEILIVDEVLAVGDAQFQKKCLAKIEDAANTDGRTVLMVSHNTAAIDQLCDYCLMFDHGRLADQGETGAIVQRYLSSNKITPVPSAWLDVSQVPRRGKGGAWFVGLRYSSGRAEVDYQPYPEGPLDLDVAVAVEDPDLVTGVSVDLYDQHGTKLVVACLDVSVRGIALPRGTTVLRLRIDRLHLNPGLYVVGLWIGGPNGKALYDVPSVFELEVIDHTGADGRPTVGWDGAVTCDCRLIEMIEQ